MIDPIDLIGKTFDVSGYRPDGTSYTHGACEAADVWDVPGCPGRFGISLEDANGCAWIWPGIDRVEEFPGRLDLIYTGGMPCRPALLRLTNAT